MAGRLRQIGGHHKGLQLPLPASLPKCHASFLGHQYSSAQGRWPKLSARFGDVKTTLTTACQEAESIFVEVLFCNNDATTVQMRQSGYTYRETY